MPRPRALVRLEIPAFTLMHRVTVHYAGHVQGVGFRATTQHLARRFTVAGYVQNLSDGGVRLVVEGDRQEIDAFLAAIDGRLGSHIHDARHDTSPATGEFGQPTPGSLTIRY